MSDLLNRSWSTARPGSIPEISELTGAVGAWHRAMPYTRLVDCDMDPADARELLHRTVAGEAWATVATEIGERQMRRSHDEASNSHAATSLVAARSAAAAMNFAQMVHNTDGPEKSQGYERFHDALSWYGYLMGDRVEQLVLPYREGHVVGWLQLPADQATNATVIIWGGLSGWGGTYLRIADALNARGIASIMAEGPGQGAPRLRDGLFAASDTIDGYLRFVDYVADDPRLTGGIGIQGNSFGGLLAAHAALDHRIGACVINGAPAFPTVPKFRSAREQICSFLGADDIEEAEVKLEDLAFDPAIHRLKTPTLILQGGADPLALPEVQQPFMEAAEDPASQILLWPDGEHTLYNHSCERNTVTADWFYDHLCNPDRGG